MLMQAVETVWVEATEKHTDTPYAVSWLDSGGIVRTGRVVGISGDCYIVEGRGYKADYSWCWDASVPMVDALPAIGGAACWLDVDALLWARWDDGSEGVDLQERCEDLQFWLNGY